MAISAGWTGLLGIFAQGPRQPTAHKYSFRQIQNITVTAHLIDHYHDTLPSFSIKPLTVLTQLLKKEKEEKKKEKKNAIHLM